MRTLLKNIIMEDLKDLTENSYPTSVHCRLAYNTFMKLACFILDERGFNYDTHSISNTVDNLSEISDVSLNKLCKIIRSVYKHEKDIKSLKCNDTTATTLLLCASVDLIQFIGGGKYYVMQSDMVSDLSLYRRELDREEVNYSLLSYVYLMLRSYEFNTVVPGQIINLFYNKMIICNDWLSNKEKKNFAILLRAKENGFLNKYLNLVINTLCIMYRDVYPGIKLIKTSESLYSIRVNSSTLLNIAINYCQELPEYILCHSYQGRVYRTITTEDYILNKCNENYLLMLNDKEDFREVVKNNKIHSNLFYNIDALELSIHSLKNNKPDVFNPNAVLNTLVHITESDEQSVYDMSTGTIINNQSFSEYYSKQPYFILNRVDNSYTSMRKNG